MLTVDPYDPAMHATGKSSREGHCGQGGRDTCSLPPVFSVQGESYTVAACDEHLAGAVRQALGMAARH